MNIRQLCTAMGITICLLMLFTVKSHASTASVYSVVSNPIFSGTTATVTTITRKAANDAIYKATVQTVSKAVFLSTFRKAISITPYGVGALAAWGAYDYFYSDELDDVVTSVSVPGVGWANYVYGGAWYDVTMDEVKQLVSDVRNIDLQKIYAFPVSTYYQVCESRDNGASCYSNFANFFPSSTIVEEQPVSDDDLWQQWIDYVNDNPEIDHSIAFYDETGQVNQDYFPDPVYYDVTPEDQILVDLYGNGLLQSSDPAAANYVTPEEYARIKDIYDFQNRTAEEQAEDLTADGSEPITQAEHAANLAAQAEADQQTMSDSISDLTGLDINADEYSTAANDGWDDMIELLNTTGDLPDTSAFLNYFDFTSSTGCQTLDLPYGLGVFPTASQCEKLGTLKTLLAYFLSVLMAWNMVNTVLREAN